MPSVTVAISCYEGDREYLDNAIQSAEGAEQVIVCDNGGTNADIAADYHALHLHTHSLIESRQAAIEYATGDYLIHLDADDWLNSIPECEGDWCFGDLMVYDGQWNTWDYSQFPRSKAYAMAYLRERRSLPVPMKAAFRVAWLRENKLSWYPWPGIDLFGEDVMTCIKYLDADPDIRYIDPFYCYRIREGQGSQNDAKRAEWLKSLDSFLESID